MHAVAPVGIVETRRLILRLPEISDARALMTVLWDAEAVERKQVTLHEAPAGLDLAERNTRSMVQQWERRGYGQWSVIERATQQLIGVVGFYHPQRPWPGVDLGWALHRSRWGNGFATEAASAALAWAWQHTAIDQVISLIEPGDQRSTRIAIKIGLHFERSDADPVHGAPVHVYLIERPQSQRG